MTTTKNYFAWTRSNSNDQWIQTNIVASTKREAHQKITEQGREIEKGSLVLSKFQNA